jgi:hypothetical protein
MSGALGAGVSLASVALQGLQASGATSQLPTAMTALLRAPRAIQAIIPDVTIDERHADRVTVTQHPVADNSPVSDHAFRMPSTITMKVGFANSNLVGSAVQGFMSGGFGGAGGISGGSLTGGGIIGALTEQRVKTVYQQLLALQMQRTPFTLTTGKRTYPDKVKGVKAPSSGNIGAVIITELGVTTDHTTEYSLIIEVHMTEVIQVNVQTSQQPSVSDQANPQKTASPTDSGNKSPTPQPDNDTSLAGKAAGVIPVKTSDGSGGTSAGGKTQVFRSTRNPAPAPAWRPAA